MTFVRALAAALALVVLPALALAQAPAGPPARVRGAIESVDGRVLMVRARDGSSVRVHLAEKFSVSGVVAATLADVVPGKFVGIATLGRRHGALVALEVLIFPEAMRGAGEGHYPWDLKPESLMTNATVADVLQGAAAGERVLTLRYNGGRQKVLVPEGAPIVTFVRADASALKPGAHVFVARGVRRADGGVNAARISVGLDGLVPPM